MVGAEEEGGEEEREEEEERKRLEAALQVRQVNGEYSHSHSPFTHPSLSPSPPP